jgi:hypothetical protein
MPIRCTIDHDKRFVHVEATGPVTLDDVLAYFDRLVIENAMPYPKLFDASRATAELSDADVMVLGARVSAYSLHDPRGPLALVAQNERIVEFLRRFMNLGMARRPAMLFRRVDDARRWLDRIAIEEGLRAPPRRPGEPHGTGA